MTTKESARTGQCYCGAVSLRFASRPETVAICHCLDCRRLTGAALPAFAAFSSENVTITPDQGAGFEKTPGVRRWFCKDCGSPLAATFDYLPGQIYVPVGVLDFAPDLMPAIHCHAEKMLPWLHDLDGLPRHEQSARSSLLRAEESP